jgi:single-stranded-DNA-specific exonuclease
MAVGLTIKRGNLDEFAALFDRHIGQLLCSLQEMNHIMADYRLPDASMLTKNLAHAVQWLQPFGESNPEPIFLLAGQRLIAPKQKNGHLIFHLQGQGQMFPGIGFHLAHPYLDTTKPADVLFQLKRTWFRGVERSQVQALMLATP